MLSVVAMTRILAGWVLLVLPWGAQAEETHFYGVAGLPLTNSGYAGGQPLRSLLIPERADPSVAPHGHPRRFVFR